MRATTAQQRSDHAVSTTSAVAFRAPEPTAVARVFVMVAGLALMVACAVTYGANLPVDLALAAAWTALVALVWELGARALAHLRRRPGETG